MKYLLLLHGKLAEPGTPEARAQFEAYTAANQAMIEAGVFVDCAPLQPVSATTTVRVRAGEVLLRRSGWPAALTRCCEVNRRFGACLRCCCSPTPDGRREPTPMASSCPWRVRTGACGTRR